MYLAYYNLSAKPFQISTDPAFLWLGPKHREALSTLRYGVLDNRGFLLLTGDVGTGKTTLIHALLKSLSQNVVAATVPDPGLAPLDFFNYISRGFQFGTRFSSKGDFLDHFIDFLETSHKSGKKVLLIIDESQRLTPELLEEIRLLSNIEKFETKLLNIFFVGQNEFNDFLMLPGHKALRQRITINYHIAPLTKAETGAYIRHRLKVAGARMEIFDDDGIGEVFHFSSGYPRLINIICDHAMLTGFIKSAELVTGEIVRRCAADLTLPGRDVLQAEVAQARKPAPPLQDPPAEPAAPAPRRKGRWRTALLVLLLASILLGAFLRYRYPSGFERLQALWQAHFGGKAAQTTDLPAQSPPPAPNPAVPEPAATPAFPVKPATPPSGNTETPPAPTPLPTVKVAAPQDTPGQTEPPQPSPSASPPPQKPVETAGEALPAAPVPRMPSPAAAPAPLTPAVLGQAGAGQIVRVGRGLASERSFCQLQRPRSIRTGFEQEKTERTEAGCVRFLLSRLSSGTQPGAAIV